MDEMGKMDEMLLRLEVVRWRSWPDEAAEERTSITETGLPTDLEGARPVRATATVHPVDLGLEASVVWRPFDDATPSGRVRVLRAACEARIGAAAAFGGIRRSLILPADFDAGFCPYMDVACGFPLVDDAERWILAGSFEGYWDKVAGPLCVDEGPRGSRSAPLETWASIAPHGGIDLFYSARRGLVVGLLNRGRLEPQLREVGRAAPQWTQTDGRCDLAPGTTLEQITDLIAYAPQDSRFWWQEGMEHANATGLPQLVWRIAADRLTTPAGEPFGLYLLGRRGVPVMAQIERIGRWRAKQLERPAPGQSRDGDRVVFCGELAPAASVHREAIPTEGWQSGVYRAIVGGERDPRSTVFVLRPPRPGARILFVCATNQWRSYAFNGHYHGGLRKGYPWSYCYSSQIMEGVSGILDDVPKPKVFPMQPRYYNNMPSGFGHMTLGFVKALEELAETRGDDWRVDYCGEEDVHFGRVELEAYRLVILDNHAEYSTWEEMAAFRRYIDSSRGYLMVLGGDAFGRLVHYTLSSSPSSSSSFSSSFPATLAPSASPANAESRILWQNLHRSNCDDYPHGAQFTDQQRFERFGICVSFGLGRRPKHPLVVTDNAHPIMQGWNVGDVVSVSTWECDDVWPAADWQLLVRFGDLPRRLKSHDSVLYDSLTPGLAIHRTQKLVSFGPMGLAETLLDHYGDRAGVMRLLEATVGFCIGGPTAAG